MARKAAQGRSEVDTYTAKVTMAGEMRPLLEALAALGVFGATPAEVIRRFAEQGIRDAVFRDKMLESARTGHAGELYAAYRQK